MTLGTGSLLLGAGDTGYNLQRSLRFRASAGGFLNRTLGTPTDSRKFTLATWMKRGKSGGSTLFGSYAGDVDNFATLYFNASDQILYYDESGNVGIAAAGTSMVFRDFSAWYHIMFVVDTSQAVAADRMKFYVNGAQVSFGASTQYGLNDTTRINFSGRRMQIGATFYNSTLGDYFDGYSAETYFIDGQALTPSSFGSTNSTTGVWQPARYTGTYGTNGFYLPFTDNSALTTSSNVGLGKDFSGNGNYWTTNNISITSGVTYDSMTDVPTLTSATAANYPVLNRILPAAGLPDIRDANLYLRCADPSNFTAIPATILLPKTGKWYAEFTAIYVDGTTSILDVGLLSSNDFPTPSGAIGASATSYSYRNTGSKINNSAATAYGASYVIGDVIAIAFDATAGTLTFYKNNVSQGVAFSGLTLEYFFAIGGYNFAQWQANFGQRPFAYTPPTGFVALNAYNLPAGTITTSGSFTGNVSADGPSVYLNGVPTAMTINGNAVTFGTQADKTAYGFKVRSSSTSYNSTGTNTYSVTTTGANFKYANAQGNP